MTCKENARAYSEKATYLEAYREGHTEAVLALAQPNKKDHLACVRRIIVGAIRTHHPKALEWALKARRVFFSNITNIIPRIWKDVARECGNQALLDSFT